MRLSLPVDAPDSERWPIAAAMLPFGAADEASPEVWRDHLGEVVFEGFTEVDLTDSWLPIGNLAKDELAALASALDETGLRAVAVSAIRRSVLDPLRWTENLAYLHRTIDAAAELGCHVVSAGLHRALTPEQRDAFWFWTAPGHSDHDTREIRSAAASRFRELGRHAGALGMKLSLEMYEDTLLGSSDSAVRLVEEIDLTGVGLNPDLANIYRLHRSTEPFLQALERCLPYANYWHVKSYYRDVDPATGSITSIPAPMASGSINYRAAIKLAISHGFRAPFCVEHYGGDGLTVMAENRDYIRRILRYTDSSAAGSFSNLESDG